MRRSLPWLSILLIPCLLFPGAIPGPEVVSADDHLSVHHAFQDQAGGHVNHPHLSDPALQFAALRKQVVSQLKAGMVPLWNPDIWAGAPLLGDGQSMVGSPVTWLRLFLAEDQAQDAGVYWVLVWLGLGTAVLSRRLGASSGGMAVAAAAAMTGPFTMVWLLHPHAATFAWIPWVLWGIEARCTWGLLLATAGLLMGGHPQTAVHGLGLAVAWAVWRRQGLWSLGHIGLGALLSAPIWLPFAEEVLRSASLIHHGGQRIAPAQLLDLVWPGWHGHPAQESWSQHQWTWADGRLHPGLGALALGLIALRNRSARVLWVAWGLCLVLALTGLPGPIHHARLGSIGALFIALAAGLAAYRGRHNFLAWGLVVLTGAWAGRSDQHQLPAEQHNPTPAAWTQVVREATGCATPSTDGCGRVLGLGWALQPNTGSLSGLRDLRGYDLPVSQDSERLQSALNPRPIRPWFQIDQQPPLHLLRWTGVRVLLSPEPFDGPQLDLGTAPLHGIEIPNPLPSAWLATAPRLARTADDAVRQLSQGASTPASPPVEGLVGSWPSTGESHPVARTRDDPGQIELRIDAPSSGVVVVNDAWHPGWGVTVNGIEKPSLRVGGVFRGVMVESGANQITWRFEPWGWTWGLRLGLLGLLLSTFISVRRWRKRSFQSVCSSRIGGKFSGDPE